MIVRPFLQRILIVAIALVSASMTITTVSAETRSLKLHFIHTGEKAEIVYKKNGRYLKSGLDQLNRFLRDWRQNEPTKMDPRLFDLVWSVYKATGSRAHITVISAYRSPKTNNMLRKRSSGVAKNSQHTLGKAMDFYLPDVKLSKLRAIGLKYQSGGVGFYPRSGSPFVHLDVGKVRHWPRMNRKELASVFPDGKTIHVPSDGKPMPGYNVALASYQQRMKSGGSIVDDGAPKKSLFANLFKGGNGRQKAAPAPVTRTATRTASAPTRKPAPARQLPGIPTTRGMDGFEPDLSAPESEADEADSASAEVLVASLPKNVPLPRFAERAPVAVLPEVEPTVEPAETLEPATIDPDPAEPGNAPAISDIPANGDPAQQLTVAQILAQQSGSMQPKGGRALPSDNVLAFAVPVPVIKPSSGAAVRQVAATPQDMTAPQSPAVPVDEAAAIPSTMVPMPVSRLDGADNGSGAFETIMEKAPAVVADAGMLTVTKAGSMKSDDGVKKGGRLVGRRIMPAPLSAPL